MMGTRKQGLWSENENDDIDRAIAISLVEDSPKANNVIGECSGSSYAFKRYSSQIFCF